ncbi:MAG TPA: glycoside hydrolase family 3 protein, partial [Longimicrobiales bacterium]|nr:glycoside hydrolase family 3 protein [Longimicrobiales bacterium]
MRLGRGRTFRTVAAAFLLQGCGAPAPTPPPAPTAGSPEIARPGRYAPVLLDVPDADGRGWVDSTLATLDLRAAAAQLVIQWMPGAYLSPTAEGFDEPRRWVEEEGIGGIYLSIGSPHSFAALANELQARARIPLLVASDLEDGGPGMRLSHTYALPGLAPQGGGTAFPPTMAVGATGSEALAFEYGRVTGREARAVGVHLNFAPVLDVNSNPENPVIGTRAFGGDPETVARLGTAFIRGLRAGGALATAKHFPGHGDTRTDSHETLPVVQGDRNALARRELVPFRAAVEAGVDAIMTAHVALPDVLGPEAPPATLSPEILTDLLRRDMAFDGLVVTDALQMAAVADRYGDGDAAVRAMEAGTDILLMPGDVTVALDAIEDAVARGRLTETRIRASTHRVLTAKARVGLHRERFVDLEAVDDVVGSGSHLAMADSLARAGLVLLRDPVGIFEGLPGDSLRVLSITVASERNLPAGRTFDAALAEAGHAVTGFRVAADADAGEAEALRDRLAPRRPGGAGPVPAHLGRHRAGRPVAGAPGGAEAGGPHPSDAGGPARIAVRHGHGAGRDLGPHGLGRLGGEPAGGRPGRARRNARGRKASGDPAYRRGPGRGNDRDGGGADPRTRPDAPWGGRPGFPGPADP